MKLFKRTEKTRLNQLPDALTAKPVDPVNYNSVLDYLVGLSEVDYDKMCKVTGIYREANSKAAEVLGVADQPTTILKDDSHVHTDDEIDTALDQVLTAAEIKLLPADGEPKATEPAKEQAPSTRTNIDVQDK